MDPGPARLALATAIDDALGDVEAAGWSVAVYPVWVDQVVVPAVIVDDFTLAAPDPRTRPAVTVTARVLLPDRPAEGRATLGDALFAALADLTVDEFGMRTSSITPGATLLAETTHPGYVLTIAADHRALCGIAPTPPPAPQLTLTVTAQTDLTVTVEVGNEDPDTPMPIVFWGDGTSEPAVTASHTYDTAGTYTIVARQAGRTASKPTKVTVTEPPPPPQLTLTVTAQTDLTVTVDVGNDDPEAPAPQIGWGDGTSEPATTATHTYDIAGTYTITAQQIGRLAAPPVDVTVTEPPPPPQLTLTVTEQTDLTVTVDVGVGTAAATVDWDDGTIDTTRAHTYATAGTYTLVAEEPGFVDSTPVDVTVTEPPPVETLDVRLYLQPSWAIIDAPVPTGSVTRCWVAGLDGSSPPTFTYSDGWVPTSSDYQAPAWIDYPEHTWTTPGTYTVTVTRGTDTGTATITVQAT